MMKFQVAVLIVVFAAALSFQNCTNNTYFNSIETSKLGSDYTAGGNGFDGKPGTGDWLRTYPNYQCPNAPATQQALIVIGNSVSQVVTDNCAKVNVEFSSIDPNLNFAFYNPNYFSFAGSIFELKNVNGIDHINESLCRIKNNEIGVDVVIRADMNSARSAKVVLGKYANRQISELDYYSLVKTVGASSTSYRSPDGAMTLNIQGTPIDYKNLSGTLVTNIEGSSKTYNVVCQKMSEQPVLVVNSLAGVTYFVDRASPGSDANSGLSESSPFFSIPRCASAAQPGDTCLVKNGTYSENILLRRSGTAGNIITYKNYSGHNPVISFTDTTTAARFELLDFNWQTTPTGYVTIEGFEFTNAKSTVIKFTNGDNIVIRRNFFRGTPLMLGINGNGYRITFDRNVFLGIQSSAINVSGKQYLISNNIFNGGTYGVHGSAYAYDPATSPNANYAGFADSVIANNVFAFNLSATGIMLWNPGGGLLSNVQVLNNIFYQNGSGVTFLDVNTGGNVINNNLFYANSVATIRGAQEGVIYTQTGNMFDTADPLFVNAAQGDFHLQATSPAIDGGIILNNVTNDFEGNSRPRGLRHDIGAFEF
jgi:hypothetical protein